MPRSQLKVSSFRLRVLFCLPPVTIIIFVLVFILLSLTRLPSLFVAGPVGIFGKIAVKRFFLDVLFPFVYYWWAFPSSFDPSMFCIFVVERVVLRRRVE